MTQDHKTHTGKRYAVSPRYQTAFVDPDTVFMIDEHGYMALQGKDVVAVLRCLQQAPCTVEAVAEQVADVLSADAARAFLAKLIEDGYVLEHHDDIDNQESAYWHAQGIDPRQAADRLRQARVALQVFGPIDGSPLARRLHQMNIEVINPETENTPADLTLVCTDDYLRDAVQIFNRQAWATGHRWMLCKPVGATPWLGPLIVPGRTACAACMAAQLQANRRAEAFLRQTQGRTRPIVASVAQLPGTVALAFDLAALEVAQGLAREAYDRLGNTILTLDLPEFNLEKHHVRRLSRCPVCGLQETGSLSASIPNEDRHRRRRAPHAGAGRRV